MIGKKGARLQAPANVDTMTHAAMKAYARAATKALRTVNAPPLEKILLFGSRARGTHSSNSGADVALVLRGRDVRRSREFLWDIGDLTYAAQAEFAFLVSPVVLWSDLLATPSLSSNPDFYCNVSREGVVW